MLKYVLHNLGTSKLSNIYNLPFAVLAPRAGSRSDGSWIAKTCRQTKAKENSTSAQNSWHNENTKFKISNVNEAKIDKAITQKAPWRRYGKVWSATSRLDGMNCAECKRDHQSWRWNWGARRGWWARSLWLPPQVSDVLKRRGIIASAQSDAVAKRNGNNVATAKFCRTPTMISVL